MRSRVQEIALLAYSCVKEVKGKDLEGKYLSHARKFPSMIVHNGVMTTLTFMKAKASSDEGWKILISHIERYMREIENKESDNLLKLFGEMELSEYRLYTQKLLYFAQWLKRMAEGELKDEQSV